MIYNDNPNLEGLGVSATEESVLTVMDCTILHILANCDVYKVKLIFEYLPACRNMELIE